MLSTLEANSMNTNLCGEIYVEICILNPIFGVVGVLCMCVIVCVLDFSLMYVLVGIQCVCVLDVRYTRNVCSGMGTLCVCVMKISP